MAKQRSNEPGADTPPTDDAQAFRAAVRDVKRLAHTPPPQGLATPKKRARRRAMPALEDLDAAMRLRPCPRPAAMRAQARRADPPAPPQ